MNNHAIKLITEAKEEFEKEEYPDWDVEDKKEDLMKIVSESKILPNNTELNIVSALWYHFSADEYGAAFLDVDYFFIREFDSYLTGTR